MNQRLSTVETFFGRDHLDGVPFPHFIHEKVQDLVYGFSSGPSPGDFGEHFGTLALLPWKKGQGWPDGQSTGPDA